MHRFNKYKKRLFDHLARGVVDTPPVACDPSSRVVVLSQSYHADLTMYLVAAKSFARHLRPRCFVVVDDGLTAADHQLLRLHLGDVRFVRSADVDVGSCPRRGCWERLASIAHWCQDHYVIQLDSDTVTRACPDEVLACVRDVRCFTLGTGQGRTVVPALQAAEFASGFDGQHVQLVAERALRHLPGADQARYVRGCAGFAGFAPGSLDLGRLQTFSDQMSALVGPEKWREWGSEQFASNYMVANAANPVVLQAPVYLNWTPTSDTSRTKFLHFISDHRFKRMRYAAEARRAIAAR